MAIYADRVKETTTTTGLNTYELLGASVGYRTFVSGTSSGSVVTYCAEDGINWEIGEGVITAGNPDTLTRTTILSSSNSNLAVDWISGSKDIFLTAPAERLMFIGDIGASGYSGINGLSGTSGFSGVSGASVTGASGYSGAVGATGTSGYSGSNGTAGVSGYSGTTGSNGASGYSGISGTNGTAGASGYSGISGTNGTAGASGYSGISGYSGKSGYSGATGSNGASGYSGISGTNGTVGASGYSGSAGSNGTSGYSGSNGTVGASGYSGVSGATGSNGASGYSGTNGTIGASGYSGATGITGTSGYSGATGITGTSGYSGATGITGTSGYSGISGYSGKSGYSGATGSAGTSGYSGTNGTNGGGLTATAIKTANYNASATELVLLNSTAGSFNVNLPSVPANNTKVGVFDIYNVCGTNPVTVIPQGGDTVEGANVGNGLTGVSINISGAYIEFIYNSTTFNWKIAETPAGGTGASGYSGATGSNGASGYSGATGAGTSGYSGFSGSGGGGSTTEWSIVATGTNQATAYAITNTISFVSTTAAGTGVILPVASGNAFHTIVNHGANDLNVWPHVGESIYPAGVNVALVLPSGATLNITGGGAFGGWRGIDINTYDDVNHCLIMPNAPTTPPTPNTGSGLLYSESVAGRTSPEWKDESGVDYMLQSCMMDKRIGTIKATPNVAAVVVAGMSQPTVILAGAAVAVTNTSRYTRIPKVASTSSPAAGLASGFYSPANGTLMSLSNGTSGGFLISILYGNGDTLAGSIAFAGLRAITTAPSGTIEPSTFTDCIGIGAGTADTTMSLYYGGSAAQTAISLPAYYKSGSMYLRLTLYAPLNEANTIYYKVNDITTSTTPVTGKITATTPGVELPLNTAALYWRCHRGNNATATASSTYLSQVYFEENLY
jgi:hypothetical protein